MESTTATTSSNSRSMVYLAESPLLPRPRRSNVYVVKCFSKSGKTAAQRVEELPEPCTRTSGGPSPPLWQPRGVPSLDTMVRRLIPCFQQKSERPTVASRPNRLDGSTIPRLCRPQYERY